MNQMLSLDLPVLEIIEKDFAGLYSGELGLSSIKGGQTAANQALAQLDIAGYAARRSEVLPKAKRGATVLSPYIRHNLLTLPQVHRAVKTAPYKDREKFQDELYWQEYARHLYARIGWLVNQTRMWLSSHWTVRNEKGWIHGQDRMYRELIDGSRAANLLGWQWTVGAGTGKPYGFARWQVEKRAPGLCNGCALVNSCPIEDFPEEVDLNRLEVDSILEFDPDPEKTAGPNTVIEIGNPDYVLLTIDSLGDDDPALTARPDLPAVFVFNAGALHTLQLSSRRIGFYLETLQDLAQNAR